jgi:hypothetical protein
MSDRRVQEWVELTVGEVGDHPDVIDAVFDHRVHGVTVTDVLTANECERAVAVFEAHRHESHHAMFGRMLGIPLAELASRVPDPTVRDLYLDDAEANHALLVDAFGGDPHDRVAPVVEALAGGRRVRTPVERDRRYASGNVRWFDPGQGGLPSHVDNEFDSYTDGTLAHLQTLARTDGHLSWFVVLQEPSAGGALSVYEQHYGVHRPSQAEWNHQGRDDSDFDDLPAHQVAPPAGSLVVFGGGWRWHRVDRVLPGLPRITYGGFAADAHDRSTLYLWF